MPARDMLDVLVTQNRVVSASQATLENITRYVDGLSFTSTAMGGFATAALTLTLPDVRAWRFINDYLGCRLVVTNPMAPNTGSIVWEGLIYSIDIDDGQTTVSRSMSSIYNRVRVIYSALNTAVVPPVMGVQTATADADYAVSANTYGIRELTYTIGGAIAADATSLRDTLLSQYSTALASVTRLTRGGSPGGVTSAGSNVSVQCVGYWETLDKRVYRQTVTTTATAIDTIIKAVLTSCGQFANTDQSNVGSNPRTHSQYFHQYLTAQSVIGDLCAKGGTANERWYFGLYESGMPYYTAEPTTVTYRTRRMDPSSVVYDVVAGRAVPPWLVRPGKIIVVDDLMPDGVVYSSALENSRAFVIGEARFTAPYSLEITPQVADPSQVQLAKIAMLGVA